MRTSDFDYPFDESLIAKYPLKERDLSKLMVVHTKNKTIEHRIFMDVIEYFREGDVLVFNVTKVIPARLMSRREKTGGKVEILISKFIDEFTVEAMVSPGKKAKIGDILCIGSSKIKISDRNDEGLRILKTNGEENFYRIVEKYGTPPIPPYLKRESEELDKERYQSVFAKIDGSCAAPTASLHFTSNLIEKIKKKGVIITEVLLHVGIGTFRPVKTDNPEEHKMHTEYYRLSEKTAAIINRAKKEGRRVFAVGTTTVRVLETCATESGTLQPGEGETDIFIYPPYKFKIIDNLITNFHFPRSTLIMLVCALGGKDTILNAYKIAVEKRYRFYSYGDAMLILSK